MIDEQVWQITEFATIVSKHLQEKFDDESYSVHYNTIDKWFKALEDRRIHYINRTVGEKGEKIYDNLDLQIAKFIAEARKDNRYRLDVIYEQVARKFDVRPFPADFGDKYKPTIDEELLKNRILEHLTEKITNELIMHEKRIQLNMEELVQKRVKSLLPPPVDPEEERAKRLDEAFTRHRLEMKCEDAAIEEWNKLPEQERTKKAGLFRREENLLKREQFIREYKRKHMTRFLEEAYTE